MSTHPIPLLYRFLFTFLDPFFCTLGVTTHLLPSQHPQTLTGYSTTYTPTAPIPVSTVHLMHSLASFYAFLGLLEAVLLRVRARDVAVWRTVEGAACAVDAFMVYGAVEAMKAEGRWDLSVEGVKAWRGDDWRLVFGNTVFGVFRLCVALGVGMGRAGEGKGKVKSG